MVYRLRSRVHMGVRMVNGRWQINFKFLQTYKIGSSSFRMSALGWMMGWADIRMIGLGRCRLASRTRPSWAALWASRSTWIVVWNRMINNMHLISSIKNGICLIIISIIKRIWTYMVPVSIFIFDVVLFNIMQTKDAFYELHISRNSDPFFGNQKLDTLFVLVDIGYPMKTQGLPLSSNLSFLALSSVTYNKQPKTFIRSYRGLILKRTSYGVIFWMDWEGNVFMM